MRFRQRPDLYPGASRQNIAGAIRIKTSPHLAEVWSSRLSQHAADGVSRMTQSNTSSSIQLRSLFPHMRAALATGFTLAALLTAPLCARAQATDPVPDAAAQAGSPPAAATPDATPAAIQAAPPKQDITLSNPKPGKQRKQKDEKVVQSKDTRKEVKKVKKDNVLAGVDMKLPDKALS